MTPPANDGAPGGADCGSTARRQAYSKSWGVRSGARRVRPVKSCSAMALSFAAVIAAGSRVAGSFQAMRSTCWAGGARSPAGAAPAWAVLAAVAVVTDVVSAAVAVAALTVALLVVAV